MKYIICGLFILAANYPCSACYAACVHQESPFDIPDSTMRASVSGERGERLYLHPVHPTLCPSPNTGACRGRSYVLSSDNLAVSNTCEGWSYVQYIGVQGVSTGWVKSDRLLFKRSPSTFEKVKQNRFVIEKGKGIEVCDAYLQVLNSGPYTKPTSIAPKDSESPYCDRPEGDAGSGFSKPRRVPMPAGEVNQLTMSVHNFTYPLAKMPSKSYVYTNGKYVLEPTWNTLKEPSQDIWRYTPQVDIDNDGKSDNVVIWRNPGGSPDAKSGGVCALSTFDALGEKAQVVQLAYVLNADSSQIDETRTTSIFWRNAADAKLPEQRPIGTSVGIFKFGSLFYFDTFLGEYSSDPHFYARNKNALGVFLNREGHTRQICEFRFLEGATN